MTLKEQIISDLTTAMKARDAFTLEVLRMLKADIMKYEVSGADKIANDEVVIGIVKRSIKQRKEAAEGFKNGGNIEAAEKEIKEITVLEKYMPEQMDKDQVKTVVQEVIDHMSATPSDFGKVMGVTMSKLKGQADGNMVSSAVKELLKN